MKKSFMTRILATGLSFAMAFSMAAATNVTPASAASKPVLVDAVTGGSGRAVTVNVGEVAKLKVNAATKKTYAVSSVKKSSKKIKTAVNKKGTVVYVRGVAETGEKDSAIRVSFKVKKTGKISKFTFASKVKVVTKEAPEEALAIASVVQKKASAIEVTFNKELEAVKNAEFAVTRADGVVRTVKSATPSTTDKKVVTVEVYESLTDGKDYTVKYTPATGDALEKTFTATAGKPAEIALSTTTVSANVATEIKYIVKDANGIELSTDKIGSLPNHIELTKTFSAPATDYIDGDKLFLKEVDNTVTLKFVYRTYNYKDGEEIGSFTSEIKVTAVPDTSTVDVFEMGVADSKPNFDKDTLVQWIALGDKDQKAFFRIKDSNKTDVTSTVGYTVESNNPAVILASGTVKDGADLVPVKAGTAVLVLKNAAGETVKTVPIEVKKQRVLSVFDLSTSSVTIATKAAVDANAIARQTVFVTAKDQYGKDMDLKGLTADIATAGQAHNTDVTPDKDTKTLTVGTKNGEARPGDYRYTIKATADNSDSGETSISKTLTVTCKSATGSVEYALVATGSGINGTDVATPIASIDTTITKENAAGNKVGINFVEKKNGVVTGYAAPGAVTVSAIKVQKIGGDVIATTGASVKGVTCEAIDETHMKTIFAGLSTTDSCVLNIVASNKGGDDVITKNLAAGQYRVTYTLSSANATYKNKDITCTFEIKDTQAAVKAEVVSTKYDGSNVSSMLNNAKNIVFYLGNEKLVNSEGNSTASATAVAPKIQKSNVMISKVDVVVPVCKDSSGTQIYLAAKNVAVNTNFTNTNGGDWQA